MSTIDERNEPSHRQPAAVLVIDLVRHSSRAKAEIRRIQATVEDVFGETLRSLAIEGVLLNYTGDGYVCAFPGNAAGRVIDFINAAFPTLQQKLGRLGQSFRGGLDFGLIHPRRNRLTGGYEHFDEPGIRAARLEQVAPADQILCSEVVHSIFAPYYPTAFLEQMVNAQTRDRVITCYRLVPADFAEIKPHLMSFIYNQAPDSAEERRAERDRILLVEDEAEMIPLIAQHCARAFPWAKIDSSDGSNVIADFRPGIYAVALLDLMLPTIDGYVLAEALSEQDTELVVVMQTALSGVEDTVRGFDAGAFKYITKPYTADILLLAMRQAIFTQLPAQLRLLRSICPQYSTLMHRLQSMAGKVQLICAQSAPVGDIVQSMARHKLKGLVLEFCDSARPGVDLALAAGLLDAQAESLARLVEYARRAPATSVTDFLRRYVVDLRKKHDRLDITLEIEPEAEGATVSPALGAVLSLVNCELIDNAIAAVGESGRVTVSVVVLVSTRELRVTIRDSGPGVVTEHLGRLFQSGFSTKGPGRGLGLYLAREAVRRLGGDVAYTRHNDTSFTAHVPLPSPPDDDSGNVGTCHPESRVGG